MLEDRSGAQDMSFLTENLNKFMAAAKKRPELTGLITTYLPDVPQIYVKVDRDKVLKQGVALNDVYGTLQTFMGGNFVNYFNRFGRQWQVYVEAEDKYRASVDNLGLFYVRNKAGPKPAADGFREGGAPHRAGIHSALQRISLRANQRGGGAGLQLEPGHPRDGGSFRPEHAKADGFRLFRHVLPGKESRGGRQAGGDFRRVIVLRVFDSRRAIRELVAAVQRAARDAHGHFRRVPGAQCAGLPEQRVTRKLA